MIEALGSPGAFFVPKTPLFRAKNRLKLPNYSNFIISANWTK